MSVTETSRHHCFDGWQIFASHPSQECGVTMRFSLYLPPAASRVRVPVLYYLAGLTCTEETFVLKGGGQRFAAETGIAIAAPDTSPRGTGTPGADADWDFGAGAGFYVDATEGEWERHYRMYSYILELRELVLARLPADPGRTGIFGHSMGGHGALVMALRNPALFRSVSAFAPIAAPSRCPWGRKAFGGYLGADQAAWARYDASALMGGLREAPFPGGILVDQGLADKFLPDQLNPDAFEAACQAAGQPLTLRRHAGYDHGYYFISTFMEDHLRHHAKILTGQAK